MSITAEAYNYQRGSASVKFVLIFVAILLVANAGYNYVPVAYEAESMKTEMQTAVVQGLALPGKVNPIENVKNRITKAAGINDVPANAVIEVKQSGNVLSAHVAYTKEVRILPFGLYTYNYNFDHTAVPTGFLLKQ